MKTTNDKRDQIESSLQDVDTDVFISKTAILDEIKRDSWTSKNDFIFSCIGFAVGTHTYIYLHEK